MLTKKKRPSLGGKKKDFSGHNSALAQASKSLQEGQTIETNESFLHIHIGGIVTDKRNRSQTKLLPGDLHAIDLDAEDCEEMAIATFLDPQDPHFERKQEYLKGLIELARSIRKVNVQEPIRIYVFGDGHKVLFGERRLLASILAGKETIPALVLPQAPLNRAQLQAVENLQRADVTAWERLESIKDVMSEYEHHNDQPITTAAELARHLDMSRMQCGKYLALLQEAPDDITHALEVGRLNSIDKALSLCKFNDASQRQEAMTQLDKGLSLTELHQLVAFTAQSPQPGQNKSGISSGNQGSQSGNETPSQVNSKSGNSERKGPKRKRINLGHTEDLTKVRQILEAVGEETMLAEISWSDYESVQSAWNKFLKG